MMGMSGTMNGFALAIAGCVSLGLAAYRLRWGDDHGHSKSFLTRTTDARTNRSEARGKRLKETTQPMRKLYESRISNDIGTHEEAKV